MSDNCARRNSCFGPAWAARASGPTARRLPVAWSCSPASSRVGAYDEARKTALRYLALLEAMPRHDPVMVVKRQEIAVSLAEIALAARIIRRLWIWSNGHSTLPAGVRQTDPLWESRVYTLQARIEQKLKDGQAARRAWSDVESRVRALLEPSDRGPLNYDMHEAAVGLLTQALIGLGRPKDAIAARERLLARQTADDTAAARTWPRSRPVMPNWRTTTARSAHW